MPIPGQYISFENGFHPNSRLKKFTLNPSIFANEKPKIPYNENCQPVLLGVLSKNFPLTKKFFPIAVGGKLIFKFLEDLIKYDT